MPVAVEQTENQWIIRLEGAVTLSTAQELKERLVEGLASGIDLHLDLAQVEEIDLTGLQLLWAAARTGAKMMVRVSDPAARTAMDAGLERFPGEPLED